MTVGAPDPRQEVPYSTDGTAPSARVIATMQALSAVADPEPPGLGVEFEATYRSTQSPPSQRCRVLVTLSPEEYRDVPVSQVNALLPGTSTDRIAREYEQVLDGSGVPFELRVSVFGSNLYLYRDTRDR